jgi:hypothetical protein
MVLGIYWMGRKFGKRFKTDLFDLDDCCCCGWFGVLPITTLVGTWVGALLLLF